MMPIPNPAKGQKTQRYSGDVFRLIIMTTG
jgi:hypothetical protein